MSEELLIVDDDAGTCETLSDIFRDKGYGVTTAGAGREALDRAEQTTFDAALIDVRLPDMDGMKVLNELKKRHPHMVCVMMTGHADLQNVVASLEGHANGYFVKPLVIEEVVSRFEEQLERQRLERKLQESEEQYRSLVETSPDAIISIDEKTEIIFWNAAACEIFGYAPEEVLGKPLSIIIPKQYRQRFRTGFKKLLETGKDKLIGNTAELEGLHKDGMLVPCELFFSASKKAGSLIIVVIARDITERKRAAEMLNVLHHFLETANRHTEVSPLLKEFTAEVKELTSCAAVGIRILDEQGNIPYQAYRGFSRKFYESESPLSIKSDECMCINVVKGDADPHLPYYTEGGSFYMNGTTRFLATVSEAQKGRTRNVCNQSGYESVALVPIRSADRILGLIHIADRKENMVPLETVELLEGISVHLGTAVQRVSAEEALAESEQRFRAIVDSATDGILLADLENKKFHMANRTICQMLGYSLEEIQNLDISDIHPAEDLPHVVEQFEKQSRGEISLAPDLPVKRKDGSVFYADVNSSPILLAGKKYLMGIFRDITERKRAEEALERLRRQYELILSSAGEGIFGLGLQGKVTFTNLAATSMLGYEAGELIGESHHEAVHHTRPDGSPYPKEECPIYRAYRDGLVHQETGEVFWSKDGASLPVEYTSSPIREGGKLTGAVVVFRDISERIQAAKTLKESEEKYRDLIESAGDLIQSVGPDGRILYANRIWRETLGYSEEELGGLSVVDIVHPESREHCMEVFRRVLSGEKVDKVEAVFVTRDGKNITVEGSVNCRFKEGRPVSTRGIYRDVTEYRALENQLRQSQKLEAVGRLAGGVAHDFNNMLTVITGYGEHLLSNLTKGDSTYKIVEEIMKAGQRAASLTHQLLAFSRKQILQPEVVDLNTGLTNIEKMLRRLIGEDIDLVVVTDPTLGRVEADPAQIDQILMNLAVNARDAMPEGGKLTIETANVELDEAYARKHVAARPGPYVMLAMSDTGIGMDSETQSHIFEPFFSTKEEGKGTGLGLPTVYGIVKQSGGNIWVYSEPGQGTTFKIYLPRVEGAAEPARKEKTPSETFRGKETILLVEDEEMVRDLARFVLVESGYTVLEAGNGVEALQVFEQHEGSIHLVLTDVVMPQMSGRDLAERINLLGQEVKVLYMSGYTDNAVQHHGILSRGTNYLQKPFTPAALLRKVREVLQKP